MELHFHRTPIILSATSLKNLTTRYNEFSVRQDYPVVNEESYEQCKSAIAWLRSSLKQIKESRDKLQNLYSEIRDEYKNYKNKSEKKDLILEIEQIEEDSKLLIIIAESEDLSYMLTARLDEAIFVRDRMEIKLGYATQRSQRERVELENDQSSSDNSNRNDIPTSAAVGTEEVDQSEQTNNQPRSVCRSIRPPQAALPKFFGNAEEFPEYWAVFETLVHNSKELDTMEKILLLKESLQGKAQASIKGITLVPQNYEWIIRTLQENYCNQPINRSQVVQKLVNLKPASNVSDSCSTVFDQIQILVNQMVSTGYDVRDTCHPMWCESILAKFPSDVVKPVLLSNHSQAEQTIGNLIGQLKKEIAAKGYVEKRLGHSANNSTAEYRPYRSGATQVWHPAGVGGCSGDQPRPHPGEQRHATRRSYNNDLQ
ncbi:unnamed protein product [Nippostrongylus brasiliensis]|uniref:Gag_pre-integrs domain-containing protein n=1 Tax=Nippostrongylus brasiliensis TaxID=27835 RepID=A0A0N4Y564_NIPBR|nr:unnamed protein product [Nippostrongylus brasiliensis]